MTTGEDVRIPALYASDCCSAELIFDKYDTFGSCPRCEGFCEWDLIEYVRSEYELDESWKVAA
jgi:hypothetical protein